VDLRVGVKLGAMAAVVVEVDVAARAEAHAPKSVPMAAAASLVWMVALNRAVRPAPNRGVAVVVVAVNAPSAAPSATALTQKTRSAVLKWKRSA
jgi:hypothetical protein